MFSMVISVISEVISVISGNVLPEGKDCETVKKWRHIFYLIEDVGINLCRGLLAQQTDSQ